MTSPTKAFPLRTLSLHYVPFPVTNITNFTTLVIDITIISQRNHTKVTKIGHFKSKKIRKIFFTSSP